MIDLKKNNIDLLIVNTLYTRVVLVTVVYLSYKLFKDWKITLHIFMLCNKYIHTSIIPNNVAEILYLHF